MKSHMQLFTMDIWIKLLLLLFVITGCLQTPAKQAPTEKDTIIYPKDAKKILNPLLPSETSLEFGKLKYETYCALCHGLRGEGEEGSTYDFNITPSSLISYSVKKRSEGELYWATRNGINNTKMLAWKEILNDTEIWHIISYIRALQEGNI